MPVKVNVSGAHNIVVEGDYYVTLTCNNAWWTMPPYDSDFQDDFVQFLHGRVVKLTHISNDIGAGLELTCDISDQKPPGWHWRTDIRALELAASVGHQDSPNLFGYLEHDLVKRIVQKAYDIEGYREYPEQYDIDPALEPLYP